MKIIRENYWYVVAIASIIGFVFIDELKEIKFTYLINNNPDTEDYYHKRAEVRFELEDYQGAISDLSSVITLNPKDDNAYYNRALALIRNDGDINEVLRDVEKALDIDTDFGRYYSLAGLIQNELGNYEKTVEVYSEALKFRKDWFETDSLDAANEIGHQRRWSMDYKGRAMAKLALGDSLGYYQDIKLSKELENEVLEMEDSYDSYYSQ